MKSGLTIGVIGDFEPGRESHLATNEALNHAAGTLDLGLDVSWIPTPDLGEGRSQERLALFDGLVCSPGSPYSMEGTLAAIRFAREYERPFLGT